MLSHLARLAPQHPTHHQEISNFRIFPIQVPFQRAASLLYIYIIYILNLQNNVIFFTS